MESPLPIRGYCTVNPRPGIPLIPLVVIWEAVEPYSQGEGEKYFYFLLFCIVRCEQYTKLFRIKSKLQKISCCHHLDVFWNKCFTFYNVFSVPLNFLKVKVTNQADYQHINLILLLITLCICFHVEPVESPDTQPKASCIHSHTDYFLSTS